MQRTEFNYGVTCIAGIDSKNLILKFWHAANDRNYKSRDVTASSWSISSWNDEWANWVNPSAKQSKATIRPMFVLHNYSYYTCFWIIIVGYHYAFKVFEHVECCKYFSLSLLMAACKMCLTFNCAVKFSFHHCFMYVNFGLMTFWWCSLLVGKWFPIVTDVTLHAKNATLQYKLQS